MCAIFISYRRDDSAGFAGALERELATRLGAERVFMDVKDIEGGTEFPIAIEEAIKSSEVVLVLIGSRWLDARDGQGVRRLEKADDFVRQEVARGLMSRARVIPVMLDGAQLPTAGQLPSDLHSLCTRQALELRNSHWDEDLTRLMDHVREAIFAADLQEAADKKIEKDFDPIAPGSGALNTMLYIVLGIGAVFAVVGLGLFISQMRFLSRAKGTTARVVNLLRESSDQGGTVYRPQLEYVGPTGQTAHVTLSVASDPPEYAVGDVVPILFDPKQPSSAIPDTFWGRWLFAIIFGGVGILVCVGGMIPFAWRYRRRRKMRRLLKEGRPIVTAFHSVEQNTTIEVNGRHPFFVITQWRNPVSHQLVQFRSPALWEDPTVKAKDRMITVVVDPENFHDYVMDLSYLRRAVGPEVRRL
jgi:Protein of unknown function (DUF3592)/TIR domain